MKISLKAETFWRALSDTIHWDGTLCLSSLVARLAQW